MNVKKANLNEVMKSVGLLTDRELKRGGVSQLVIKVEALGDSHICEAATCKHRVLTVSPDAKKGKLY